MKLSKGEVLEKLCEIIAEITGFEPEEINEGDSMSEDIGIESFDIVDINFRVEEVFGVQVGEKAFWNFRDIFENPDLIDENNVLTLKGIQEIKRRVPNIDTTNEIERLGKIPFMEMLAAVKVGNFVDYIHMNLTK